MSQTNFMKKAVRANSIRELVRIFDTFLSKNGSHFGVEKKYRVNIDKQRIEANAKALQVLNEITDPLLVTEEQKEILRGYTGGGKIDGSTDEYYTPKWLASGVWDALSAYGADLGNVCEPSAGTGVFNGSKPQNVIMTATEISEVSAQINQILHPEDEVRHSNFEKLAADPTTDNTFDAIVGNVPFGEFRTLTKNDDPAYADIKTKEAYFILRAIDKVKHGGYLTLILPQNIVSTASMKKIRRQISLKAEFLGAHKIPSGSFANQGSDSVVTDVIVLRKHSEEMTDLIIDAEKNNLDLLRSSLVLWDTFIKGQWFEKDGKKFIHGEQRKGEGNYGGDLYVIPDLPSAQSKSGAAAKSEMVSTHNASTAKAMSKKFESRIDWTMFDGIEEQAPITYTDGDRRLINGRWHEFEDGDWLPTQVSAKNGLLDSDKFGVSSITDIEDLLSTSSGALSLTFDQLTNIHHTFSDKTDGVIANAFLFASKQKDGMQERVVRGALIGDMIERYKALAKNDPSGADTLLKLIRSELNTMFDKFGTSHDLKVKVNTDTNGVYSKYQSFVHAMTKDGEFSDLINDSLNKEDKSDYDTNNPERVIEMLTSNKYQTALDQSFGIDEAGRQAKSGKFRGDALRKATKNTLLTTMVDDFKSEFTGTLPDHVDIDDDNSVLDYLSELENVAINEHGQISAFDRATSGNISERKASLSKALALDTLTSKQRANITRQLDAIEEKRKAVTKSDITFKMRDKWIPSEYVLEFLHENGFDDIDCKDGFYYGYSKDAKRELIKDSDPDNGMIRQFENYLNGSAIHGGGKKGATAKRRDEARRLEIQFHRWMLNHENIDELIELNKNAFHDYIPFEHSEQPLNLKNVSGDIENMPYQNSGIRRLSEEGKGILGFGTGLGKTFTALGLVAFNKQEGRSNRSCIVVPKAVNENWINETCDFYGYSNMSKVLCVGFDFERDEETGEILTQPILDEDDVQKTFPKTGNPRTKPLLRELGSDEIASRMNKIPHSNYELVIMTKEQFAAIPMKPDSINANVQEGKSALAQNGHIDLGADNYKAKEAVESAESKLADIGSDKNPAYPYFEDMQFDDVITDEAHNYRNSSAPGREARNLRYLSTGAEAKSAVDMRQKMQCLARANNGRGAILLTATPTPNSPLDIFNMLSHLLSPAEMLKLGIANQDDFISTFGETSEVAVTRIDGTVVSAQGLTGFTNLPALRAMLDKYVNRKNIKDVASDTKVPEIVNESSEFDMTQEQLDAYEFLRLRAEVLSASKAEGGVEMMLGNSSPESQELIFDILTKYPDDQIFSIIRDMDRASYDIELFKGIMTFIFKADKDSAVKQAISKLPEKIMREVETVDDQGAKITEKRPVYLEVENSLDSNGNIVITVPDAYEDVFIAELKKVKVLQSDITHPVSPKYAQLIENMRKGLEGGGKQIIFTEEKSQHRKLHRILSHHLNLEPSEIGILNGDTVSGISSASNADGYKKLSAKKIKEIKAAGDDAEGDGLEAIASKYNAGKFKVLICNKKAEVGVNLHIKTSDIHHLSIPWSPASVDQRNGRGARVGAPQEFVKAHNYLAKESFDQFRLDTVNRKRKWQEELITGDKVRADNGDADSEHEQKLLMARNPEEAEAMIKANKRQLELDKIKAEQESANSLLSRFVLNSALAAQSVEELEENEEKLTRRVANTARSLESFKEDLIKWERELNERTQNDPTSYNTRYAKEKLDETTRKIKTFTTDLKKAEKALVNAKKATTKREKAKSVILQLKPQIKDAMNNPNIKVNSKALEQPSEFMTTKDRIIGIGETYFYKRTQDGSDHESIVTIESVNQIEQTVKVSGLTERLKNSTIEIKLKALTDKVEMPQSDVELITKLRSSYNIYDQMAAAKDLQTILRLWDEKLLPSINVLTFDGKDYSVTRSDYLSVRDNVIYPECTKRLQESVAKWYLARYNSDDFGTRRKVNDLVNILPMIFGTKEWKDELVKYDETALTGEEIVTAVYAADISEQIIDEVEELKLAQETEATSISPTYNFRSNAKSTIEDEVGASTLQAAAVVNVIYERIDAEAKSINAALVSYWNTVRDANSQKAKKALALSDDAVKERLGSVIRVLSTKLPTIANQNNVRYVSFLKDALTSDYEDNMVGLLVDLIKAGYAEPSVLNGFKLSTFELYSKLQTIAALYKADPSLLESFATIEDKASSYVEEADSDVLVVDESVDTSALPFAQELFDKYGVKCKKNTEALSFQTKRGKEYGSAEPYEMVGFYDPKAKDGKLAELMMKLKKSSRSNPKAMYPQCSENSEGFDEFFNEEAFWWFVRVDDVNLVKEALL